MWKKEGVPDSTTPAPRFEAAPPSPAPAPEPSRPVDRPARANPSGERATIGRSITIRGEVSGDEDLLIQGRVDGSVNLKQHLVTIGPEGEVKANVSGRVVTVEGKVQGNLSAEEQVILRSSAIVEGDISAPRLVLEDGARFRGGVDMGEGAGKSVRAPTPATTTAAPSSGSQAERHSSQTELSPSTREERGPGGKRDVQTATTAGR